MYTYIYVCAHVYIYTYINTNMYTYHRCELCANSPRHFEARSIHTSTQEASSKNGECTYIYTYTHIYIHIIHLYISDTCIYVHIYTYTDIYIYMKKHVGIVDVSDG